MTGLNTLERDDLLRKIAWQNARIDKIERMLKGEQVGTARIADAAITNAKIKDLTWDKAQGGTATLGGLNNVDGILSIKDNADVEKIVLDKDGILVNGGKITIKKDDETTIIDEKGVVSSAVFGNYSASGYHNALSGPYEGDVLSSPVPELEITTVKNNVRVLIVLTVESFCQQINTSNSISEGIISYSLQHSSEQIDGPIIEFVCEKNVSNGSMDNMKANTRSATTIVNLPTIGTYTFQIYFSQADANVKTTAISIKLSAVVLGQ